MLTLENNIVAEILEADAQDDASRWDEILENYAFVKAEEIANELNIVDDENFRQFAENLHETLKKEISWDDVSEEIENMGNGYLDWFNARMSAVLGK